MIDSCTTARRDQQVVREDRTAGPFDPAVVVLDMLCAAMHALAGGRPADDVVCRHLARGLAADAGVTIAMMPDGPPVVATAHPDTQAVHALADHLLTRDLGWGAQQFQVEFLDGVGHVASMRIAPTDPQQPHPSGHGRLLIYVRRKPFGPADRMLLDRARDALLALWPHAARSVRAQETQDWVREAIDETRMTDRELQVLELLAQGLLATSIASRLQLSPRTVHKHLGNIYRKLGVHDRLVAVSIARLQGLLEDHPTSALSPVRV